MYWENPGVLLGLWILPVVAGLLVYAHRRRAAAAGRFADPAMVRRLMPSMRSSRPWIKGGAILLALAVVIVAGARPRFGVYFEEVTQRGVDLFVLLDVSRSMTAEDVAPNRLERAKSDVRDLLKKLTGDRVGLVAFAGKPVVKVPLTSDRGFFRMVLDEIDVHSATRGGSLIGDGIRKCLEAMPESRNRDQVIVMITDGEDHDSYPKEAAQHAAERGVKIFTVGLGDSREGSRVPLRDSSAGLSYLKYRGQEVWSKVDERLLKEIALATNGAYIPAGTRAYDLGQIYENHLAQLTRGEIRSEKRKRYREQFQLFVCLGIALLLFEMVVSPYQRPATRRPKMLGVSILLVLLGVPATSWAGVSDAAEKVKQGVAHFHRGDFQHAGKAFAEADVALPDDPRIAFDRACAYSAGGDLDKAVELFQRAALSTDVELATRCQYNLGNLSAAKARGLFGEHPEQASAEVRQEGLSLLAQAVAHYRDCLDLEPQHADARHNLEVIRLWIKHMQALWQEQDRQKQREEMDLLQFLMMIDGRQRELRAASKLLADAPDSPQRRQALTTGESSQRSLAEEIEPLKEKIAESLGPAAAPGGAAPGTAAAPSALGQDMQQAVELLTNLADEAARAMVSAADSLGENSVSNAVASQADTLEHLDQIYMAVAPFPNLVQRAIGTQQGLVDRSTALTEPAEDAEEQPTVDFKDLAWNQRFVARWSEMLPPKAKQGLKNLETSDAAVAGPQLPAHQQPTAPHPQAQRPGPQAQQQQQQEQIEGLKRSMEKAVELGPKVQELASGAADHLQQEQPDQALPKQQEALKLLREIAEPLPKQDQQQQGEGPQDEQPSDDQQQPSGGDQQQQQQQKQRDLSQQQAESVLRRARERQQQRRKMEKQLQQYLYRGDKVEKDW